MNPEKRKRENKAEDVEQQKKKSREEEEVEIEEFYAILKRIHVAAKYFQKDDDESRRRNLTAANSAWKPSFEVEDFQFQFQGDDGVKKDGGVGLDLCAVTDHKGSGLDLNSEPKPEWGEQPREDPCLNSEVPIVRVYDFI
ncbi:hypothetical protein E2542_SST05636 [Spatholobus suberectus]|nr:hypothetical protein E2542_SST05636 [Spatholobus suberectus]